MTARRPGSYLKASGQARPCTGWDLWGRAHLDLWARPEAQSHLPHRVTAIFRRITCSITYTCANLRCVSLCCVRYMHDICTTRLQQVFEVMIFFIPPKD